MLRPTAGPTPPPTAGLRPALVVAALGAGSSAAAALEWWGLGTTGADRFPLWAPMLTWAVVLMVRADPVQRVIGGGRLDNRVGLRLAVATLTFTAAAASSGLTFVFPLCAALAASVHLQWSGSRTWRQGVGAAVLGTVALEVAVHLGWLHQAFPVPVSHVAAAVALVLSVSTVVNVALLTAQRETADARLAAEQRRRHDELVHAATHDDLTGLLDRAGLRRLTTVPSQRGTWRGALFVDLDDFKAVNDTFGHATGDGLLSVVADRLRAAVRPADVVARTGGDEFVVLLAECAGGELDRAAARVERSLRRPAEVDGQTLAVSASVGRAAAQSTSLADLLHAADDDMYARKHAAPPRAPEGSARLP